MTQHVATDTPPLTGERVRYRFPVSAPGMWRLAARRVLDAHPWHIEHARLLAQQVSYRNRNADRALEDHDHLRAAAVWLAAAQDAMPDGGVSGRYRLKGGWSSSYPETTGYIVPTLLALADVLQDHRFRERASRAVDFLLRLQLADGAFPAGEVHENISKPSVFNTAQILHGLVAWHAATRDPRALAAARRAGDWLVAAQDADGAWRKHQYLDVTTTYTAHASCWLAELGRYARDPAYLRAAERHLEWVLTYRDRDTGWIDLAGFSTEDHQARLASTHTIAYTLWGMLFTSEIVDSTDGVDAVRHAAHGAARRLELSGRLPGVLDCRWRACASYDCLTGNAQMALIWFRLFELDGDPRLLNAALKALDAVKAAQPMFSRQPGIRGGVPGSDPLWGDYLYMALPSWGAKFLIDALLAKRRVLQTLQERRRTHWTIPADTPRVLRHPPATASSRALRVVLYTAPGSTKVAQMVHSWSNWGFKPAAVVLERRSTASLVSRLRVSIRQDGVRSTLGRLLRRRHFRLSQRPGCRSEGVTRDVVSFCTERSIPLVIVDDLNNAAAVDTIRALQPDLAIHAGAGILRAPLLAVPRLGTLNAHMGILPRYRGMNVAEWAQFEGGPVGCSVHLIAPGIDTGDIVCVRPVNVDDVASIAALRQRVDDAQIILLGDVVRYAFTADCLPSCRPQELARGVQFFRMHRELAGLVEAELRAATAGGSACPA